MTTAIESFRPLWKRIGKWFLWAVVSIVAIAVVFVQIANWRGARALGEAQERLAAAGETTDYAALVPPSVPAEDNFFASPLFEHLTKSTEAGEEVRARLEALYPDGAGGGDPGFETGKPRDLIPALEAFEITPAPDEPEAAAFLAAYERKFAEILAALDAAAARPSARLPSMLELAGPNEPLIHVAVPHLPTLQRLGNAMKIRGIAATRIGDRETALASLEIIRHLDSAMRAEPVVITQLVGMTFRSFAREIVWEALAAGTFTDRDLEHEATRIATTEKLEAFVHALRGELAGGLDVLDHIDGSRPSGLPEEFGLMLEGVERVLPFVPQGWIHQNRATFIDWYHRYLIGPGATGGLDAMRRGAERLQTEIRDARSDYWRFSHTLLPALVMPVMIPLVERLAEQETRATHAVVACAIERFRLAEGHLPKDLASLVPQFLSTPPEVSYTPTGDTYTLSSDPGSTYHGMGDNDDPENPVFLWRSGGR